MTILGIVILAVVLPLVLTHRPSDSSADASSSPSPPRNYVPGNLTVSENQLLLSQGLSSRIIATSDQPVKYPLAGTQSDINCHTQLGFGTVFALGNSAKTAGSI